MIYRRTARFKKSFQELPNHIKEKAAKAFFLFQENPRHPGLGIKKMEGHQDVWEGRIDRGYRFTFHYDKDPQTGEGICIFRNIGTHNILDHDP
jgi:mRNA-degrading endonuclease RelE of RelBE toxin-antitoxin system